MRAMQTTDNPIPSRAGTGALRLAAGLAAGVTMIAGQVSLAQGPLQLPFPERFDAITLDGRIGFALNGAPGEGAGGDVSPAGDLNGDGIDDVFVGASGAEPGGGGYVVFGRDASSGDAFPAALELADLDGVRGFAITSASGSRIVGYAVAAAGDVNNDGMGDLLLADPFSRRDAGDVYVVFGRTSGFPASMSLADLDGTNGFVLQGANNEEAGRAVANAGDLNGDGVGDLIIGAPGDGFGERGRAYVVFGRDSTTGGSFPAAITLADLDGADGFRLETGFEDRGGAAVAGVGDLNHDGMGDIAIGGPNGGDDAGRTYVVFGRVGVYPAVVDLTAMAPGSGVRFDGVHRPDRSGGAVAPAGDINGDGIDDLAIGAPTALYSSVGRDYAGEAYVVFGNAGGFPAAVPLAGLDGANGLRFRGARTGAACGASVASAGDINGDGVDDVAIGAPGLWSGDRRTGVAFIVYGRAAGGFPADIVMRDLDRAVGFQINGIGMSDSFAGALAPAGDVNNDGMADLVVGARGATPHGRVGAGQAYVVFGRDLTRCAADLNGDGELTLADFLEYQNRFDAGAPDADLDGDGLVTLFDFLAYQNAFDAGCP